MRNSKPGKYQLTILVLAMMTCTQAFAGRKVTFRAQDGLVVTADLYYKSNKNPYVLLFHQDGSSRGEFTEIASKLLNLDYNCLAVDLRNGDKMNFTENETALAARHSNLSRSHADAEKDMLAAIEYAYKKSGMPVILFGSSSSTALCIKVGIMNPKVGAVVAFGLGEYLRPGFIVKDQIGQMHKPLFVATNNSEYPFVKDILQDTGLKNIEIFMPANGQGEHGAKALWGQSPNSAEYWLSLLMFFGKLKK